MRSTNVMEKKKKKKKGYAGLVGRLQEARPRLCCSVRPHNDVMGEASEAKMLRDVIVGGDHWEWVGTVGFEQRSNII